MPAVKDIQFTPEHVIKRQRPDTARRERDRTEMGRRIGESSQRFSVPRIEGFDASSGTLTFERVRDGVKMAELLPAIPQDEAVRIARRTGVALAAIHDAVPCEPDTRGSTGSVCLHGDFAIGNLIFSPARDELFIIDWSGAHWLEEAGAACGPAALDLSIFLLSLFYRRPMGPYKIRSPERIARGFLGAYAGARLAEYRSSELRDMFHSILVSYAFDRQRARPLRALPYLFALWRVRRFVLGLPGDLESLEQ